MVANTKAKINSRPLKSKRAKGYAAKEHKSKFSPTARKATIALL